MRIISVRNPHTALPILLDSLFKNGVHRSSRNGDVLQLPGPTLIEYMRPLERVVFWPERDANPFLHLYESLWMLAGRNDVLALANYAKRMASFSDDGTFLNAAYGYRWRFHFGYDQIQCVIEALRKNPDDRRQVIAMWDATANEEFETLSDLQNVTSKDVPCNTHLYVSINNRGSLDMTVCNRSNDLVWGLLGANCVHMAFLLEYIAARVEVPVGSLYTMTNNLHGYLTTATPLAGLTYKQGLASPYEVGGGVSYIGLASSSGQAFDCDVQALDSNVFESYFFKAVVGPALTAHALHKRGETALALAHCKHIMASDWAKACSEWLQRRLDKRKKQAEDDGVKY